MKTVYILVAVTDLDPSATVYATAEEAWECLRENFLDEDLPEGATFGEIEEAMERTQPDVIWTITTDELEV